MVESGLLSKLPQLQSKPNLSTQNSLTPLLLSISTLANSQFPIDPRPVLALLVPTLRSPHADPSTLASTAAAIRNLSAQLDNSRRIVSAGAIHPLLSLCLFHTKAAELALATLSNLAITEEGRRGIEEDSLVPEVLVHVMARNKEDKCGEVAGYLLMVVAGRSAEKRRRMVELGVVEMLVEVGLMGRSGVARERANRVLGWLKAGEEGDVGREVRCMVKESLDRNLESILKRGGGEEEKKKDFSGLKVFGGRNYSVRNSDVELSLDSQKERVSSVHHEHC